MTDRVFQMRTSVENCYNAIGENPSQFLGRDFGRLLIWLGQSRCHNVSVTLGPRLYSAGKEHHKPECEGHIASKHVFLRMRIAGRQQLRTEVRPWSVQLSIEPARSS